MDTFTDSIKQSVFTKLSTEGFAQAIASVAFNAYPFIVIDAHGMREHFVYDLAGQGTGPLVEQFSNWLQTGEKGDDGTKLALTPADAPGGDQSDDRK